MKTVEFAFKINWPLVYKFLFLAHKYYGAVSSTIINFNLNSNFLPNFESKQTKKYKLNKFKFSQK